MINNLILYISKNCSLTLIVLVASFFLTACDTTDLVDAERAEYFHNKVRESLLDKENVEIRFSNLTNFDWDNVCFKQYGNEIWVIFSLLEEDSYTLRLDIKKYLIEEGYFPRSPRTRCYSNKNYFEIKKRTIGTRNVIQFLELMPK